MKGTVTKVEWLNPHARIYLDVKDEAGKVTSWEFELGAPNALIRKGWTRTSIKPGDVVTIDGYHAKDGSNLGMQPPSPSPTGVKWTAESRRADAPDAK